MKVDILASGSQGNCVALTTNDSTILVDVGIAKTKVESRLLEVGILPQNVKAILITHSHSDHIKGIALANKFNIPVYAAQDEWKSVLKVEPDLQKPFKPASDFSIGGWYVESFKTHHDSFSPSGYTITDENGFKVSVCLDTGHVDEEMLSTMEYSNVYIIESNHDPKLVEVSDYPVSTKARILSHIGHLSNEQTSEALFRLVQGVGEQIYLTHLSSKNNMPALAEMTTKRALAKKGLKAGKHYHLTVY